MNTGQLKNTQSWKKVFGHKFYSIAIVVMKYLPRIWCPKTFFHQRTVVLGPFQVNIMQDADCNTWYCG